MLRRLPAGLVFVLLISCAQSQESERQPPFRTVADVHELMEGMIAPAAEDVFEAVATIISEQGTQEIQPSNDEEWEEVEHRALALAESANLLMFEGRAKDQGEWITLSQAMIEKSLVAVKAAKDKNKDAFFDAAGRIYDVCQSCHMKYIPAEK